MKIKLNVINNSNDSYNSEILIFQKNIETNWEENCVAWLVIKNLGQGWAHPFNYTEEMSVSAIDGFGNHSPQKEATYGQQFSVVENPAGDALQYSGVAVSPNEVEIRNGQYKGAVDANVYKDGRLLATKTGIAPGQKAVFQFNPTIWIGAVSQIEQGDVLDPAILSLITTEISLSGLSSADIVMTGGGHGPEATPFAFTMQNIVNA